jgi:hypothetical protein
MITKKLLIPATLTIDREKGTLAIDSAEVSIELWEGQTAPLHFEPVLQELPPELVLCSRKH